MIHQMEAQKQKEKAMEEANVIQLSDDEEEVNDRLTV